MRGGGNLPSLDGSMIGGAYRRRKTGRRTGRRTQRRGGSKASTRRRRR